MTSKADEWLAIRARVADICEALEIAPDERAEIDASLKAAKKSDDAQPIVDFCRKYGQCMDYVCMGTMHPLFRLLRHERGMSRNQLAAERRTKHLRVV